MTDLINEMEKYLLKASRYDEKKWIFFFFFFLFLNINTNVEYYQII